MHPGHHRGCSFVGQLLVIEERRRRGMPVPDEEETRPAASRAALTILLGQVALDAIAERLLSEGGKTARARGAGGAVDAARVDHHVGAFEPLHPGLLRHAKEEGTPDSRPISGRDDAVALRKTLASDRRDARPLANAALELGQARERLEIAAC